MQSLTRTWLGILASSGIHSVLMQRRVILEDLNPSGMMNNRRLSRAISDLGWHGFWMMLEAKAEMYGREFRVISRWEPTSQ